MVIKNYRKLSSKMFFYLLIINSFLYNLMWKNCVLHKSNQYITGTLKRCFQNVLNLVIYKYSLQYQLSYSDTNLTLNNNSKDY